MKNTFLHIILLVYIIFSTLGCAKEKQIVEPTEVDIKSLESLNNPPLPFSLLKPDDGRYIATQNIYFSWQSAKDLDDNGSVKYDLNIGENVLNMTNYKKSLTDTSVTLKFELLAHINYSWKVDAIDTKGEKTSSNIFSFKKTNNIPTKPLIISPSIDLDTSPISFNLKWQKATDEDGDKLKYDVHIINSSKDIIYKSDTNLVDTSLNITNLPYQTKYKITVSSKDAYGGKSLPSSIDIITIPQPNNQLPSRFSLISPTNGEKNIANNIILFKWGESIDLDGSISKYTFYLSEDPLLTNPKVVEINSSDTVLSLNASRIGGNLLYKKEYYWTIQATDDRQGLAWALDTLKFETIINPNNSPPSKPILKSPSSSILTGLNLPHSFTWGTSTNAENDKIFYTFYINKDGKNIFTSTQQSDTSYNVDYSTANLEYSTYYTWQVSASDNKTINVSYSDTWDFRTIKDPNTPTNMPPADFRIVTDLSKRISIKKGVDIVWHKAIDPDNNQLLYDVYYNNGQTIDLTLTPKSLNQIDTTVSIPISFLDYDSTYSVLIIAKDIEGLTSKSTFNSSSDIKFSTISLPKPTAISPAQNAKNITNNKPVFRWDSYTHPESVDFSYLISIYECSTPTICTTEIDSQNNNRNTKVDSYTLISNLKSKTIYKWNVKVTDINGKKIESDDYYFTSAEIIINLPPYQFNLVSPASNSTGLEKTFKLKWRATTDKDSPNQITYKVFYRKINGGDYEPLTTTYLTDTVYDIPAGSLDYFSTYQWLVSAYDGIDSTESVPWVFTIRDEFINTPPTVVTYNFPANSSSVPKLFKFSWNRPTDIDNPNENFKYLLYISTKLENLWLDSSLRNTLFEKTAVIQKFFQYNTTYYWSVVAIDQKDGSNINETQQSSEGYQIFTILPNQAPDSLKFKNLVDSNNYNNFNALRLHEAKDPEGSDIYYEIYLKPNYKEFDQIPSMTFSQSVTNSSYDVSFYGDEISINFKDNQIASPHKYFIKVVAKDNEGLESEIVASLYNLNYTSTYPDRPVYTTTATKYKSKQDVSWTIANGKSKNDYSTDFYLSTNKFDVSTLFSPTLNNISQTGNTLSTTLSQLDFNTKYYIKVAITDVNSNATNISEMSSFTVDVNTPPSKPVLVFPANNTNLSNLKKFSWKESTDADGYPLTYNVQISKTGTTIHNLSNITSTSSGADYFSSIKNDTLTINLTNTIDPGAYTWKVEAVDRYGFNISSATKLSTSSVTNNLNVLLNSPTLQNKPTNLFISSENTISSLDTTSIPTVKFNWSHPTGFSLTDDAKWQFSYYNYFYEIYYTNTSGAALSSYTKIGDVDVETASQNNRFTYQFKSNQFDASKDIYWYVKMVIRDVTAVAVSSINSHDDGDAFPKFYYKKVNLPPYAPTLTTPANNSSISLINGTTFSWSATTDFESDAITYRVYMDDSSVLGNIIYTTSNTNVSLNTLKPLLSKEGITLTPGKDYFWLVEAIDSNNSTNPNIVQKSTIFKFTLTN